MTLATLDPNQRHHTVTIRTHYYELMRDIALSEDRTYSTIVERSLGEYWERYYGRKNRELDEFIIKGKRESNE